MQAFRRRLSLKEALRFSNILPAGIRALFVADWDPIEERKSFSDMQSIVEEATALRPLHNFTTETSTPIEDVLKALRKYIDKQRLNELFETFPKDAVKFFQAGESK